MIKYCCIMIIIFSKCITIQYYKANDITPLNPSLYFIQDVIALGKYSINVSGINKSLQDQKYTSNLYQLLSLFVTQSHFFPMTLNNMNKIKFIPKKVSDTTLFLLSLYLRNLNIKLKKCKICFINMV